LVFLKYVQNLYAFKGGVCCGKLLLNCNIGHAAICVKNNVYEYGKGGVKVHMKAVVSSAYKEKPNLNTNARFNSNLEQEHYRKNYKAKSVGTQETGKSFGEFCDWVEDISELGYTYYKATLY